MARAVGYGTPITIAVPAYWSDDQFAALREEFFAQSGPGARRGGPILISDATAALAALRATPGFPTDGVIALCDFGAGGTTVTLIDAEAGFAQIGPSARYTDFSGDAIDQLILDHVRAAAPTSPPPTSPAPRGSGRRPACSANAGAPRSNCRRPRWPPSPGPPAADVQLSRNEFEQLISGPLDRFLSTVEEIRCSATGFRTPGLARHGDRRRRREHPAAHHAPVAALRGADPQHRRSPRSAPPSARRCWASSTRRRAPTAAAAAVETPTEMVGTAGLDMTQAAGGPRPPTWTTPWRGRRTPTNDEPVPYTGPDTTGEYGRGGKGIRRRDRRAATPPPGALPWYKRTALVLSVAGAGAAVLVAVVLAINLGSPRPTRSAPTSPPADRRKR